MLKSRRGLLAAGLAVAVVGALGVASIVTAGAQQIPGDSAPQEVAANARSTPPTLLPWGERPEKISRGRAGTSSKSLRAGGFDAAPSDGSGATQPRGRYAPKGKSYKSGVLRSERTNVKPPEPPAPDPTRPTPTEPTPSETELTPPTGQPTPPSTSPTATTSAESLAEPDPTPPTTLPATSTTSASASASAVAPAPTSSGSTDATVSYLYNVGSQAAETDGMYATVTIGKPELAQADYHSLAELAVQSADGYQTVEVGWTIDRTVNGDSEPHLFVYHWVNNKGTCYNGCGFEQYSSTIKPGDTLASGVVKKFGIQYSAGAWWVAFDSEWVGYFPDKLWSAEGVTFTRSGLVQVFGEVAAATATTCTDMGNGEVPTSTTAALLASVTYINGPTVSLNIRAQPSDAYAVAQVNGSVRTFRYGGPGTGTC